MVVFVYFQALFVFLLKQRHVPVLLEIYHTVCMWPLPEAAMLIILTNGIVGWYLPLRAATAR